MSDHSLLLLVAAVAFFALSGNERLDENTAVVDVVIALGALIVGTAFGIAWMVAVIP